MLSFALKNMATKKVQLLLVMLSIVISAGVAVLAYNTAKQVEDGITTGAAYYSAIIGPSGSRTQLAMNTMYFTDEPLGTIPYSVVTDLQADMRVTEAIPFAMADSFNGYNAVGTTPAYLDGKKLAEGEMFSAGGSLEVVLGATVARTCDVHVGDQIYTSHAVGDEHHTPLTVVGILEETHTAFDRVLFTQLKTIWDLHEEEEEEEDHEEHDHEEMNGMVCAVLVRAKNLSYAMALVNEYDGKTVLYGDHEGATLMAIEPMDAVRSVLEDADNTRYIVYVLCAIILVMNIMVISVITILNMMNSAKEISLMRLIGIGTGKINLLYILENSLVGAVSVVLAFLLSRLCLLGMDRYVSSMGVVLNIWKVYPAEWLILVLVFVISIVPTVICTASLGRKDGLGK